MPYESPNSSAIQHKQQQRDALAADVQRWEEQGNKVQQLGPTPIGSYQELRIANINPYSNGKGAR